MDKYKKHLAEKGFSKNTIDSYLFAVRQLQERLEEDWSNQELLEHKDWLTATFAAKTANLRITAINSYLDFINYEAFGSKVCEFSRSRFWTM